MDAEAWKTIKAELDRFGLDYIDIVKSKAIMETIREDAILNTL
jgi:hypothetical protein